LIEQSRVFSDSISVMQILTNTTNDNFTRVADVKIPEIFFRKFKTGIPDLDEAFGGQGFLPGSVMTLAAPAGVGKSSISLQLLQALEDAGKKTAFISGEETIEQVSFAATRLNALSVPIANLVYIEDIEQAVIKHKFNFIVLDSYPTIMTRKTGLNSREKESHIIGSLISLAKQYEVCLLIIMHFTKGGSYKGSTEIVHAADALFTLEKNPDDHHLRDLIAHKNRFGACTFTTFPFGDRGYTFEAVAADNNPERKSEAKKQSKGDVVLNALDTPKTIQQIVQDTDVAGAYLTSILRQFINEGKVSKDGRGVDATYKKK
jgi:predicted ATP-dependent serine protease